MKLNEVIQAGNFSTWELFVSQGWKMISFEILLVLVFIAYFVNRFNAHRRDGFFGIGYFIMGPVVLLLFTLSMTSISMFLVNLSLVSNWEDNYVRPYLKSLEVQTSEAFVIKDDNFYYIEVTDSEKKIHDLDLHSDDFSKVEAEVSEPTAEFVQLKKNLGNGWDAGIYNVTLKVPHGFRIAQEDLYDDEEDF